MTTTFLKISSNDNKNFRQMATRFLKISSNGNKILKSKLMTAPSYMMIFNFSFLFSIELAKERVASMQVNSQLLEAIQQKVELSQQLEEWQTDMEQLLEGQMRQRLLYGEKVTNYRAQSSSAMSTCSDTGSNSTIETGNATTGNNSRTTSRILSFFQRN